jgi:hypothetical protein
MSSPPSACGRVPSSGPSPRCPRRRTRGLPQARAQARPLPMTAAGIPWRSSSAPCVGGLGDSQARRGGVQHGKARWSGERPGEASGARPRVCSPPATVTRRAMAPGGRSSSLCGGAKAGGGLPWRRVRNGTSPSRRLLPATMAGGRAGGCARWAGGRREAVGGGGIGTVVGPRGASRFCRIWGNRVPTGKSRERCRPPLRRIFRENSMASG